MDRLGEDRWVEPNEEPEESDGDVTIPENISVEDLGSDLDAENESQLFRGDAVRTSGTLSPDTIETVVEVHRTDTGERSKRTKEGAFHRAKRLSQIRRDFKSGKRQLKTSQIARAYGPEMATPGRAMWDRLRAKSAERKSQARATSRATTARAASIATAKPSSMQGSRSSSREASEDEETRFIRDANTRRKKKFRWADGDNADSTGPDHVELWRSLQTRLQAGQKYEDLVKRMTQLVKSWEDAKPHMVPFVAAVTETVLEFEQPFFVLRYEVVDPLGGTKVQYKRINDAEEWNSAAINVNVHGPNTRNHKIIQRGDPEENTVIYPNENDKSLRWLPVEVAATRLKPNTNRMREMLAAVEAVLITPEIIIKYLENGETVRLAQKGSTQDQDPTDADGVVHLNVPQSEFAEIAIGRKDLILSTIDGVPTIRTKSGAIVAHDRRSETWKLFGYSTDQDWPFTTLVRLEDIDAHRNLSDEEIDRVFKVATVCKEENKRLERDLADCADILDEKEEEIADLKRAVKECDELRKKLEECQLNLALKRSTEPDDDIADDPLGAPTVEVDPREKPITTLGAASQNKMLLSSIELWGKDSTSPPARPWIKASVQTCKILNVNEDIIADFLAMRLKPIERNRMGELKSEGKIYSLDSFTTQFLENYGKRGSPLSQLRGLLTRKMSVHEIQISAYYEYANRLELDAHEAYVSMGIDREIWPVIDKVVVLSAYLSAVPAELSQFLILEDVETMEVATKESRKWANALVDSRGRSALGAVVGGAQGGNGGQGPGQNGQNRRGNRQNQNQGGHHQQHRQPEQQQPRQAAAGNGGQQGGPQEAQGGQQGGQDRQQDGPRDALCRRCRELENPPASCDHCRKCLKSGHRAYQCRKGNNR